MDHVAQRVILKTAAATTLNSFSQAFIVALSGVTAVLTRLWLLDAGGELRLAGSFGRPVGGGSYNRLDGEFARMTPGTGKIGQMCVSREPFVARSLRGDESWLVNRDWIARQAVRAFLGYPLIAGDEVIGALAIFDRATPSDATLETLQFLADYAALRVIDLRERAALQAHRLASAESAPRSPADAGSQTAPHIVVTRADLRLLERRTIETALTQTHGRVFGPRGAALLLGMKPTTLASRIKALGIDRAGSGF